MEKNIGKNEKFEHKEIEKNVFEVLPDRSAARIVLLGVPDVPGVAAEVFIALADRGIGAEMIVQNNMRGGMTDIGFLVKKEFLNYAIAVCRKVATNIDAQGVSFNTEVARVSVFGGDPVDNPEIPARMFSALAENKVNIEMISSNSRHVTCVVNATAADTALKALRKEFLGESS